MEMNTVTCHECGCEFNLSDMQEVRGINYVCKSCIEKEEYMTCKLCGVVASPYVIDGLLYWCDDCMDEHTRICQECNEIVLNTEMHTLDDNAICKKCHNRIEAMTKCKLYKATDGRQYFIHLEKKYYFDEFSLRTGISLVEPQLNFKLARIEYGVENYIFLKYI